MHDDIPTREPERFTAGTTVKWDIVDTDHPPSDGWTLTYAVRGASADSQLDIEASASEDGTTHQVRLAPDDTESLAAGFYRWARYAAHETEGRYRTESGTFVVEADLAEATTSLTHEQRALALIEAKIEGRITDDMEQFSIRGRSVIRMSMAELMKWRGYYRALVRRQLNGGKMRTVDTHFTAPR